MSAFAVIFAIAIRLGILVGLIWSGIRGDVAMTIMFGTLCIAAVIEGTDK